MTQITVYLWNDYKFLLKIISDYDCNHKILLYLENTFV